MCASWRGTTADAHSHVCVSVRVVKQGDEEGMENMDVVVHAHTPALTGGCGKEVVPELGSACLWLREREE